MRKKDYEAQLLNLIKSSIEREKTLILVLDELRKVQDRLTGSEESPEPPELDGNRKED